jgi:hypothetical protein
MSYLKMVSIRFQRGLYPHDCEDERFTNTIKFQSAFIAALILTRVNSRTSQRRIAFQSAFNAAFILTHLHSL